jgi:large subunit ribosomal protein L6
MSKIGKQPIQIAQGVTVEVSGRTVKTTGPKGTLTRHLPHGVEVELKDNELLVSVKGKTKQMVSLHGTYRSILASDVKGVSAGWSKQLELVGTGFRADVQGKALNLIVGYSHPVKIDAPEGISFKVEKTFVTVEGYDKETVGQVAANIRGVRPPEPYKGKGIKYVDEVIRRKPGKAAAKATTA